MEFSNYKMMFALTGLLLVPMILPPFVGAIGFQQILGQYGALNVLLGLGPVDWMGRGRFFGVALLQALALYPILYLNASAALANVLTTRITTNRFIAGLQPAVSGSDSAGV